MKLGDIAVLLNGEQVQSIIAALTALAAELDGQAAEPGPKPDLSQYNALASEAFCALEELTHALEDEDGNLPDEYRIAAGYIEDLCEEFLNPDPDEPAPVEEPAEEPQREEPELPRRWNPELADPESERWPRLVMESLRDTRRCLADLRERVAKLEGER